MRFAISAAAAFSGLVLLGLSFFGQPAVYVHQAMVQWDALMDRPAADPPTDPDGDPSHERVLRLQREVARLKQELAAIEAPRDSGASSDSPVSLSTPSLFPNPPGSTMLPSVATPSAGQSTSRPVPGPLPSAVLTSPQAAPAQSTPSQSTLTSPTPAPGSLGSTVQVPAAAGPAAAVPSPPAATPSAMAPSASAPSVTAPSTTAPPTQGPSTAAQAAALLSAIAPPARLPLGSASGTASVPTKTLPPDTLRISPALPAPPLSPRIAVAPSSISAGSSTPERLDEPPKAPPPKQLASKPIPAPPPLPQPVLSQPIPPQPALPQSAQPRQDDDTQSIIARLRQGSPVAVSPPQPEAPQSTEGRLRPASVSSLTRLAAARTALANGRIDEGRRLLQEAQLQLVFRPVELVGAESTSAGRGAADVAHALEALSANDTPLSRRYIDIALDDLSDNATNAPLQESSKRATGYAPAYPPR